MPRIFACLLTCLGGQPGLGLPQPPSPNVATCELWLRFSSSALSETCREPGCQSVENSALRATCLSESCGIWPQVWCHSEAGSLEGCRSVKALSVTLGHSSARTWQNMFLGFLSRDCLVIWKGQTVKGVVLQKFLAHCSPPCFS